MGDTWVAASALGGGSDIDTGPDGLRDSVQRMFTSGPDTHPNTWQPETERDLSIFSRTNSKRSQASLDPIGTAYGEVDRQNGYPKSDTILSFDPNDLNPSRSASQVRRNASLLHLDEPARRYGPGRSLPVLEERESEDGSTRLQAAPTHISHITFPKPTLDGVTMLPGSSPMIASVTSSSVETGETATLQTPRTSHSSVTTVSIADPTVIAKLETHSTEHGGIAKQIDGVQVELHRIISQLGTLVQFSRAGETAIPKALDDKLTTIGLDVKSVENAIQLSSIANGRMPVVEDANMLNVHEKLDSIARLCEEVLAKQMVGGVKSETMPIDGLPLRASRLTDTAALVKGSKDLSVKSEEEKSAGEEVAQIMAELVSASPIISDWC